jgi:DNA modification methylase
MVCVMRSEVVLDGCLDYLKETSERFDLTFLDPPFNQGKEYRRHNDTLRESDYWYWMKSVCKLVFERTTDGGAIYFLQREKNTQYVLDSLRSSGWSYQSLIIWKKKTSAVPCVSRFGKHYQIIAFFTKGARPRLFNRLRINPPILETEKYHRPTGMYVTDVWDDIRELTSGYFAGDEPFRSLNGDRVHKQQSPVALLTRIILSSSKIGDTIFDPFAGTGTTLVVSKQLLRNSIGVEINPDNVSLIRKRLSELRKSDDITEYRQDYGFTSNLDEIWKKTEVKQSE